MDYSRLWNMFKFVSPVKVVKVETEPTAGSSMQVNRKNKQNKKNFKWRAASVYPANYPCTINQEGENWLENEKRWNDLLRSLIDDKFDVSINQKNPINFGGIKIGSSLDIYFDVENKSKTKNVCFNFMTIHGKQSVCKFTYEILEPKQSADIHVCLFPEEKFSVKITCLAVEHGRTSDLCILDFGTFKIGRLLIANGLSEENEVLKGISRVETPSYMPGWKEVHSDDRIQQIRDDKNRNQISVSSPFIRHPFFSPDNKDLKSYAVPNALWAIVQKQDNDELRKKYPSASRELTMKTYEEKFNVALWFEEIENEILRRSSDVSNTILIRDGEYFKIDIPGLKDMHPPVQIGDPLTIYEHASPEKKFATHVCKIEDPYVFIKFENRDESCDDNAITLQFNLSRTTYKRCHNAVKMAVQRLGERWLFPSEVKVSTPNLIFFEDDDTDKKEDLLKEKEIQIFPTKENKFNSKLLRDGVKLGNESPQPHRAKNIFNDKLKSDLELEATSGVISKPFNLKWFNTALNDEQKDAVRRILKGEARPLPYIIYGPPGTGKTVTVVEAVIQLFKFDAISRVLVVAPSNSAADVIAEYLVRSEQFKKGDFVRFGGFMRRENHIPESIRPYYANGENLEEIARLNLVVATCATAGQFMNLGLSDGHFTHVFIDEAGYCTEPEAVIAATQCNEKGQVILVGDFNQLGPVLMSTFAARCGLTLSLLERLMQIPLYSRNTDLFPNEKYNPILITKLVKNYRAHPTLLKLPSKLFYDNELKSAVDEGEVNLANHLEFLGKSRGTPLLFHGVDGKEEREKDSPSWFNKAEIFEVIKHVKMLRENEVSSDDIGIITPYRKQVEKIRKGLEVFYSTEEMPKIGSVEEFQGAERKVVILSLVRSNSKGQPDKLTDRMSFLFSSKRFNVAITRAKALLMVFGNPNVIKHDNNWREFLQLCISLNCYTGCGKPLCFNKLVQMELEDFDSRTKQVSLKLEDKDKGSA